MTSLILWRLCGYNLQATVFVCTGIVPLLEYPLCDVVKRRHNEH